MENKWREDDVPWGMPECGAIFMSNIATKMESFKRKVFALPSSMGNFVKQVKEGMVLFLFEYEKRQLFGVYRATSDGAMNIVPHAFNYSGKRFPAQVRFTPIWVCSPLLENEFRDAIKENYFSAKKFNFGLSEDQVRQLLQLFYPRKLNDKLTPRQFARVFTRSAGKERKLVDHGMFSTRERLKMENCEDDFTSMGMSEFLENSTATPIEDDEALLFNDNMVEKGKMLNTFRQNFLTVEAGDSQWDRERLYENEAENNLYETRPSFLSYRTGNQGVSLDGERIPASNGRFLMAKNTDNDCNIYTMSPNVTARFTGNSFDLTRADYKRPLLEGKNRRGIDDDRFLMNDSMKYKLKTAHYSRPVNSNEHEDNHNRPERATDGCEFFMSNQSGYMHDIDDNANTVLSEKCDNSLHGVKGTLGDGKHMMDERIASDQNLDYGIGLNFLPEKLRNPSDNDQRTVEGKRFLHRDKVMKANYSHGIHGSSTSYMAAGYDRSIPRQVVDDRLLGENSQVESRQDFETYLHPVLSKYTAFSHLKQNSLDCFSKPSPDTQLSQLEGSQNFQTVNSTFNDSIVSRTVHNDPELCTFRHGNSLSTGFDRGASLPLNNPPYSGSGGHSLALSKSKTFDREGFGRYDPASYFGSKEFYPTNHRDFSYCYPAQVHRDMESSAPADDRSLLFSPSTLGSIPLTESHDLSSWKKSSLASVNCSMLSQGLQKHIHWRANEERIAGSEILSSNPNLAGLNIYRPERYLKNDAVECYESYKTDVTNDDIQSLSPGAEYSDIKKRRKSVFARLTSTPRVYIQEEKEKDAGFYLDASVDEVMDMLNSSQKFRMKNLRKFKPVVRQHGGEELARSEEQISIEEAQPRPKATKMEEGSHAIEEGVDEKPKETRTLDFKRRSELKKGLDENSIEDKQQKRRKLVRPVFSHNVSVEEVIGNHNLPSQSQSQSLKNKI